ncbi:MAPEG family protein [Aquabacterium sp.]|uniref:MAPEG family protein n=1 Tax=Aquabacterium sp. TaxID=1872578 RepID=UPI003B6D7BBC
MSALIPAGPHHLAIGFVVARVVYVAMYLMDIAVVRSLVWALGFGLCVAIMALAG